MKMRYKNTLALTVAALFAPCLVPVAQAQQAAPGNAETLDEIVVSATKRTVLLQDVPFSVASQNEAQIRNSGADSIVDLARNVAGLTIADLGPGQSQIAIRGISSGQVIRDQAGVKEQVGVYLDETPISVALFTPDLVLYDIDRFEVLRGPQGTLFGSGSESGTLRYITRAPRLNKTEANVETTGEVNANHGTGGSVRTMVNSPLGDKAAVRAVAYTDRAPGFIDSVGPGGTITKNINAATREGGRVALLFKPSETFTVEPRFVYQHLQSDGFPRVDLYNILANQYTTTQPAVTMSNNQQYRQLPDGMKDNFRLADVKLNWDLGGASLTSLTSYTKRDLVVKRDASQLTGSVTVDLGGPDAAVRLNSPLYDSTGMNVFSEELRIASPEGGKVEWLGGAFFQHVIRHYGQNLPTPGYDAMLNSIAVITGAENPADTPYYSDFHYGMRQAALFGEATWHLDRAWSATAGLRYYNFNESRSSYEAGVFANTAPPPASVSSNGASPRAILSYKANQDVQFNAQVARGFRLGGINDPLNTGLCTPADLATFGGQGNWKDEKAWNYELNSKMRLLDHKASLNVSVFDTEIKDLQATVTAGTCSSRLVYNVPTARSRGLEVEYFVRPTVNWDFGVSATMVDAKLTSSVTSTNSSGVTSVVGGLASGNQLPTAAKMQAVGSIGYNRPLSSGNEAFGVFTLQYVGSSYSQFENESANFGQIGGTAAGAARLIPFGGVPANTVITFNSQLPSYSLANLRVGIKNDKWEIAGFVNNIANEHARLALDYERGRSARVGYITNQPRMLGFTARYNF
jgi:iron complex outermembrane receptor protein